MIACFNDFLPEENFDVFVVVGVVVAEAEVVFEIVLVVEDKICDGKLAASAAAGVTAAPADSADENEVADDELTDAIVDNEENEAQFGVL